MVRIGAQSPSQMAVWSAFRSAVRFTWAAFRYEFGVFACRRQSFSEFCYLLVAPFLQIGLDRATKLAQGADFELALSVDAPLQADGEPLGTLSAGTRLSISLHPEAALMLACAGDSERPGVENGLARALIEWAVRAAVIDAPQSERLLTELQRRLQILN